MQVVIVLSVRHKQHLHDRLAARICDEDDLNATSTGHDIGKIQRAMQHVRANAAGQRRHIMSKKAEML